MQSKITSFVLPNDEPAVLYGNYDNLRPVSVHGIAHAFTSASEVLITLYSLTGMKESSEHICSADLRLSLDKDSLAAILRQLQKVQESLFPNDEVLATSVNEDSNKKPPAKIIENERLSAPL